MTLYTYTAEHPDGKKVRGTVDAVDKEAAISALKDLHYEVDSLTETSRHERVKNDSTDSPSSPSNQTFVFEGKDPDGIVKKGTTQAPSKKDAYDRLTKTQGLSLHRLSPVGVTPQSFDRELEEWNAATHTSPQKSAADKADEKESQPGKSTTSDTHRPRYHSIVTTLRLYAGWLLAWYGLFIALGYYSTKRDLPWDIPFVAAFSRSDLVVTIVAAIFLFLLLSTLHIRTKGSSLQGVFYTVLWLVLVVGVRGMQ